MIFWDKCGMIVRIFTTTSAAVKLQDEKNWIPLIPMIPLRFTLGAKNNQILNNKKGNFIIFRRH